MHGGHQNIEAFIRYWQFLSLEVKKKSRVDKNKKTVKHLMPLCQSGLKHIDMTYLYVFNIWMVVYYIVKEYFEF